MVDYYLDTSMFPLFFFVLLLLTSAYLVQFKKTYFDPSDIDILYMGDAVSSTGFVDMNRVENCCVGWAIYAKKVPLWDPNIGKLSDFTTFFSFTIGTVGSGISDFGDGLASFLAPTGFIIPPNTIRRGLGLLNNILFFSIVINSVPFRSERSKFFVPVCKLVPEYPMMGMTIPYPIDEDSSNDEGSIHDEVITNNEESSHHRRRHGVIQCSQSMT